MRSETLLLASPRIDQEGHVERIDQLSSFPLNPDSVIYSESTNVLHGENEHEIMQNQQEEHNTETEEDVAAVSTEPAGGSAPASTSDQVPGGRSPEAPASPQQRQMASPGSFLPAPVPPEPDSCGIFYSSGCLASCALRAQSSSNPATAWNMTA